MINGHTIALLFTILVLPFLASCAGGPTYLNFDTAQLNEKNFRVRKTDIVARASKGTSEESDSMYSIAMKDLWKQAKDGVSRNASVALVNVIISESNQGIEIRADLVEFTE